MTYSSLPKEAKARALGRYSSPPGTFIGCCLARGTLIATIESKPFALTTILRGALWAIIVATKVEVAIQHCLSSAPYPLTTTPLKKNPAIEPAGDGTH